MQGKQGLMDAPLSCLFDSRPLCTAQKENGRNLVLGCLVYRVSVFHADGFRFNLTSILIEGLA